MVENFIEKLTYEIPKLRNPRLDEIVKETSSQLNKEHKLNVMVVSNAYGGNEIVDTLSRVFGVSSDVSEYAPTGYKPYWLHYTYGEDNTEAHDSGEVRSICVHSETDFLKETDVTLCIGVTGAAAKNAVINDADYVIFVSNALMAFTMDEKEWLKEFTPVLGAERIGVSLYNVSHLNTKDDVNEVVSQSGKIISGISDRLTFFPDIEEAFYSVSDISTRKSVFDDARQKTIAKNSITILKRKLEAMLDESKINIDELNAQLANAEKERKKVELAGKIAVGNLVSNLYIELSNMIREEASDYNDGLYDAISQRIKESDNPEKDIRYIPEYLRKAWEEFAYKMTEELGKRSSAISAKIDEQLQADCNKVIEKINIADDFAIILDGGGMVGPTTILTSNISAPGLAELLSNKKVKRGAIAVSVGLALFVNPAFIIPAFAIPVYLKARKNGSTEDLRHKALSELYSNCVSARDAVVEQMVSSVNSAKDEAQAAVGEIYSQYMEGLMKILLEKVKQVSAAQESRTAIEETLQRTLPELDRLI